MRNRSVLLEIGVEEMPARFLPGALRNIREIAGSVFSESGIGYKEMKSFATPRRLALVVEGVPQRQSDKVREVFGPPKQAAYAEDGTPTKAAVGFARSQGVEPEDLVIKPKGKGEYVAAVVEEKGRPVEELLPEMLKKIILSLHFPKSMRWGEGEIRFARPLHWVLALFGNRPVSFELDGIASSNRSRGHRFLAPREFAVRGVRDYIEKLRERYVLVDVDERMNAVRVQAGELAAKVPGTPAYDEELLSILACLVEYPVCVLGSFQKEYLALPDELLISVMVGHQKYIPVKDAEGGITSSFIVVSNTTAENADIVREGAERVIRPRLEDARFYFESDRKRKLVDRLEDLGHVTFQDRLGSVRDKTARVGEVAGALAEVLCPGKKTLALRAAELSKTDLVTGVVREFPELQGIMGMYYARHDGEDPEVALALREQYLPGFSGDRVPESDTGTVLSLADRVDNLASFFSIGLKPTGSEDPFALRRQALGVISILTERKLDLSIRDVLSPALSQAPEPGKVEEEVLGFFEQRLEPLLASQGYEYDLVQSVIKRSTVAPLKEVTGRLDALREFTSHPGYNDFLVAIKRVKNISPEGELPPVDESLFSEDEERALKGAFDEIGGRVRPLLEGASYAPALEGLLALTSPINTFFDKVLVMDKDERIKRNRLSLLKGIWSLADEVADFSKLQERN